MDIWLPRVQFHVDYRSPARLDELLDVGIGVARIGRSSIRFEFTVSKAAAEVAAEGYLVIVAIIRADGRSVDVPRPLVEALAPYRSDL